MTAPRDPEAAFILGTLYQQLGGSLVIDPTGQRRFVCDLDGPQGNLTGDERLRVGVMLEGLLKRLHPADAAFLFDAMGDCSVEVEGVSEPTRRAA
jgi:hypothetical protein